MSFLLSGFGWFDIFLFINILLVLSVVFLEHKNASATWAWIMIMLFVPIVGFILYLFIGQDLRKRKTFSKKEEEDNFLALIHRQQAVFDFNLGAYSNPLITSYKDLIHLHLSGHEALYTEDNEIELFTDGCSLFKNLFTAINNAKSYVHIESYIIRDDGLGNLFKDLLIKKANEGIKVFVLYDEMGCFGNSRKFFGEMRKAGIKVSCFFRSYIPFIKKRANYRNHRKLCIIDGEVAYLGGFNIGNEYIGLNKKFGYWRDTHMKLTGSSVHLINLQFLLDRRFATGENLSLEAYIPSEVVTSSGHVGMQIVSSGPDSKYASIHNGYIKMIHSAKQSVYIQTPYFIPDDGIMTALKLAALSGKDVRIMIPNKPDHMCVYWATYSHIGELLESGVRCFTYENGFLHAKTIVVDEEICSVGTANFDIRSFKLNFEINGFIYNKGISQKLVEIFKQDLKLCEELTLEKYKNRSLVIKFKESISRLISPIL
ncbi:cardiolipin synthase [Cellulosilyticum sp. WCF-2]|uniref:cardiolipin synthase n=1 Tax=Cellulosilyticum sp. WCF-2 TaxID=2497860 RepID=UPI000F8DFE12|nr:cardiolipin synthase [Cellulosilyticum sp. WCF-2]QEH70871.1 cardiolipin synthase [Cellulosilyticum sp. WCF-2]